MRSVPTVPDDDACDCDWPRELRVDRFAPDIQSTSTRCTRCTVLEVIINRAYAMAAASGPSRPYLTGWGIFPRAERCRKVSAADGGHGKTVENSGWTGCFKWLHRDDQPSTWLLENGEPRFCGHHWHMYPYGVQPVSFNPGGTKISPGRRTLNVDSVLRTTQGDAEKATILRGLWRGVHGLFT
jgi:hypothetical protein